MRNAVIQKAASLVRELNTSAEALTRLTKTDLNSPDFCMWLADQLFPDGVHIGEHAYTLDEVTPVWIRDQSQVEKLLQDDLERMYLVFSSTAAPPDDLDAHAKTHYCIESLYCLSGAQLSTNWEAHEIDLSNPHHGVAAAHLITFSANYYPGKYRSFDQRRS